MLKTKRKFVIKTWDSYHTEKFFLKIDLFAIWDILLA
jgi:hypothetical protein